MWLSTDYNKHIAGILYSMFAFKLLMKIQDKAVSHCGSQIFRPCLNIMSPSQVLQGANGFYQYCTCPNEFHFIVSHRFSVYPACWRISQMLTATQHAATYTFTKYLLQHGWPIWNLGFQKKSICMLMSMKNGLESKVITHTFVNK